MSSSPDCPSLKAKSGRLSLYGLQICTGIGQVCCRPSDLKPVTSYLDFSDVLPAAPSQLFKLVSALCTDAESEVGLFEPLFVPR